MYRPHAIETGGTGGAPVMVATAAGPAHASPSSSARTHVRDARAGDAVGGVVPRLVVSPADEAEVASVLSAATARGLAVVARGGGTKLDWGSPPERCDIVLSTARIDGYRRPRARGPGLRRARRDDARELQETPRVGTGVPPAPDARSRRRAPRRRVGGVVATAASGPLRTRFGTPRDLVIGASFVLADGTVGRSGGKVVKNVAGFDVAKLLVGSLGTLAVITEVAVPPPPAPRGVDGRSCSSRGPSTSSARSRTAVGTAAGDAERRRPPLAGGRRGRALRQLGARRGRPGRARRAATSGGRILAGDEEAASAAAARGDRPWHGAGRVGAVAVLPSRVAEFLSSIVGATCDALVLRPLLGTGEVRFAPEAVGRRSRRGARVRRPPGDQARRRAVGGRRRIDPVALDLMRSVKRQLDPARTLSPGRQARRHLTWPSASAGPPRALGHPRDGAATIAFDDHHPPGRRADRRLRALRFLPSGVPDVSPLGRGDGFAARPHPAHGPRRARRDRHGRARSSATGTRASAAWRASTRAPRACSTTVSSSRCARRSSDGSRVTGGRAPRRAALFAVLPHPRRMRTRRHRRRAHAGARDCAQRCSVEPVRRLVPRTLRRLDDMAPELRLADAPHAHAAPRRTQGTRGCCASRCSPGACRTPSSRTSTARPRGCSPRTAARCSCRRCRAAAARSRSMPDARRPRLQRMRALIAQMETARRRPHRREQRRAAARR